MNKYLIEILKIRTSVILPGFGALMIANTKTGKVVLNRHLKFDDGILAKYISEKEGIDTTEAKNKVSKFVREIETTVGKGDVYDIFQFGKISKDDKGEVTFEMDDSMKKESTIVTAPVAEKKPVVKKEEPKSDFKKKDSVKTTENKNTYVPPVKTEIKKETEKKPEILKEDVKSVKTDAKAIAAKVKKEAKDLEEKKKKDAKTLAAKKKEELKIATAKAKKEKKANAKKVVVAVGPDGKPVEKKKRSFLPYIILLLVLCGLGFAGFKYQNQIKEMIGYTSVSDNHNADSHENSEDHSDSESGVDNNGEGDVIVDDALVTEDTTMVDPDNEQEVIETVEKEEEVIEGIPEQTQQVSSSVNGGFHIIGGGFSEESNATGYASKNNGTVLGRFDNLYLVALKSYDSREDAQADLSNVRSISASAWIFKYSK